MFVRRDNQAGHRSLRRAASSEIHVDAHRRHGFLRPRDCDGHVSVGAAILQSSTAVRENVPRLLINREAVGPFRFCNMESCLRDVFIQAECDDGVIEFCQQLGWEDELRTIYRSVNSISILDEE